MARATIVTGGTRGIGKTVSPMPKNQGFTVVANYAGNTVKAKAFADGTEIPSYCCDVGDRQACIDGCAQVAV